MPCPLAHGLPAMTTLALRRQPRLSGTDRESRERHVHHPCHARPGTGCHLRGALCRHRRPPHQRHAAGRAAVDLSAFARPARPDIHPGGPHHAHLPGHGLRPPADDRALYRPQAAALFPSLCARVDARGPRPGGACHQAMRCCWWPPRSSASVRRSSTRRPRGWPGCRPAGASASRSRCFRWAATWAPRSDRCSRLSSWCLMGRRAWHGLRVSR